VCHSNAHRSKEQTAVCKRKGLDWLYIGGSGKSLFYTEYWDSVYLQKFMATAVFAKTKNILYGVFL
jgi:hypothetical protein